MLDRIVFTQRVLAFAASSVPRIVELSHTTSTFRDTVTNFEGTIFAGPIRALPVTVSRSYDCIGLGCTNSAVEWLVEKLVHRAGCDANFSVGSSGKRPLTVAAANGRLEALKVLLKHLLSLSSLPSSPLTLLENDHDALIAAAGAGQAEALRMLLDHGGPVDAFVPSSVSKGTWTLIAYATFARSLPTVELLLSRGAVFEKWKMGRWASLEELAKDRDCEALAQMIATERAKRTSV